MSHHRHHHRRRTNPCRYHDRNMETFSSRFVPHTPSPLTPMRKTLNRIRLVLGSIFLLPAVLLMAPADFKDIMIDSFLFYFKSGRLP